MDRNVVRQSLSSAEASLLIDDLQNVEDKARQIADQICKSLEDWTLRSPEVHERLHALDICDDVCEKLRGNAALLEQTFFTLVPPLFELTLVAETSLAPERKEKLGILLLRISNSCNAREAVLLFTQVVQSFRR
jgi:hypothetical protein